MTDRGSHTGGRSVDRRSDARIVRSALDEVKTIQTLLADVYKDAGDGRTLLRELVQNADDARATRLVFTVFEQGWPEADNGLLRGPALLVLNDGPFPSRDRDALHQALGGSKADDAGKVGRFGIGLKSVFHICEAIVYLGAERGTLRPGALNPWAGTGERDDADPIHPDWDAVGDDDLERLSGVAAALLGTFDDGLVQWIPLRRPVHLDRAQDRQYGLGQVCPSVEDVSAWFGRSTSLALLLAQCGHLRSIEADRASGPALLGTRTRLARVVRPGFERGGWVGRHGDDVPAPDRAFDGRIEDGDTAWSVVGVEAIGLDSLRRLRSEPDWPSDPHWREGRSVWLPRKALGHAAITVLRPNGASAKRYGARLRWAVFLPLDDDPDPRSSRAVEVVGNGPKADAWDIVMHGYFWPSHDRRSIPGVTDDEVASGDSAVRVRWNRAVRDDLLLPLLPSALASAVRGTPEAVARELLEAIVTSRTVGEHLSAVTRRDVLLPVVTADGVRWEARARDGGRILSIAAWARAPGIVRRLFTERRHERTDGTVFIDADAPRLAGEGEPWPTDWLESLLGCVAVEVLRSSEGLEWVRTLLRRVLESPVDEGGVRSAAAAAWLAQRIGAGALPPAEGKPTDAQVESRDAWRRVFATLPKARLVDAPVATHRAVIELASAGSVGAGLLPVPFGRDEDIARASRPDPERIDAALQMLGTRLRAAEDGSQRTRRARLLLAETLLAIRGSVPLGEELSRLPLLRARRLPDDRDEAWSVDELCSQAAALRVFARATEADSDEDLDAPSDPKRAVTDLAEALGETVWLVGSSVAAVGGAPPPTNRDLARAVLDVERVRSDPPDRARLLRRLAEARGDIDDVVRGAMIALLTGRKAAPSDAHELFYVRSQDSDQGVNQRSIGILLRLLDRAWCAVEAVLVEPLPHALVGDLGVAAVDSGVLHRLLNDCLSETVDWSSLNRAEVVHLLRRLHGTTHDDRSRWRAMPLHRGVGGGRGSFNERALRAEGNLRLPPELAEEIRLLDPDPEVADLYLDVPTLDDDGILHAMLVSRRPEQFADRILSALRSGEDGRVTLPRDPELLSLLGDIEWLPHRGGESGLSPAKLLILPRELHVLVRRLADAGALGQHRLAEDVAPALWSKAEGVVQEILGRPSRTKWLRRLSGALATAEIAAVDGGAYLVLPQADHVDAPLVDDAVQSPLAGSHPGWALIRVAVGVARNGRETRLGDTPDAARKAVLGIARSLCSPLAAPHQVSALTTLAATRPAKDVPAGRLFRRLIEIFSRTAGFGEDVLPAIELPTQDGQWHPAGEVARSASGVARRHRVVMDLRGCLGLDDDEPVREDTATDVRIGAGTAEALENYFEAWAGHLPDGAVGAFLGLLGNGKDGAITRLAEKWLGDDVNVEGMRRALSQNDRRDLSETVKVFVSGRIARGKRVEAVNLLGQRVEMEAGADDDTVFATDPVRRYSVLGDFWEVGLRDVEPQHRTGHELLALLSGTVEWWAVRVLRVDLQRVRSWWSRWGTGSQAQVGPVQASILAHLPLTLHQLDVRDCPSLRDALRQAQRAQRKREQAPPTQIRETMDSERSALDALASLIRDDPTHQRFLWTRVQEMMRRFGYREDSVLLELAQNADDALSQAAEIAGGSLPPKVRRLIVRVHDLGGEQTIDLIHYGRPINDTGGASFPAGRDRQWDQDLYFMMLLNLSGKPGETPGSDAPAATTGRFGLGFKSVHLVSESPAVVSGFLAFSIAGGLLPLEEPVPDDPELAPIHGHRATRVRLPLRGDADPDGLLDDVFRRFAYARTVLPVFARQIREVIVDGGPCAGVSAYDGEPIDGAPGWSWGSETVGLPGEGQWRMLRFRPGDAGENTGTAAVLVGLRGDAPDHFPVDLPFLWNVAPTSEGWGCGYAVNGPFKLDPGRTHVSLDDAATSSVAGSLGEALGRGLIKLHDALSAAGPEARAGLPQGDDAPAFLAALWRVLATGIDGPDELRRDFLLRLHGDGRGLSSWMQARAVVPSGLPAPFEERLPPLGARVRVEVAMGGLDSPELCRALAQVDDLVALIGRHRAVSTDVGRLLRPLLGSLRQLQPWDVFAELLDQWDSLLTPERLRALRPLAPESVWKAILSDPQRGPWHSKLLARSAAGSFVPLRELLLPKSLPSGASDAAIEDEVLRTEFAPDTRLLDAVYVDSAEDLTLFLRLRARHEVDAETMASWYEELPADRHPAALRYLLVGKLSNEVLARLAPPEARPRWLRELGEVRHMLEELGEDRWRSQALLAALFPDQFGEDPPAPQESTLTEPARRIFFERFVEWWDDPGVRRDVLDAYDAKAWPDWLQRGGLAEGLRADSRDHWLGLFVLGASRSLGRTQAGHHRSFLESAHQEGWWEVFMSPDDADSWMRVLRTWQDRAVADLTYSRWMSLFPAIFQLSRYLEKYRRLLTSAGRRPAELYRVTCLLAPRVDEALTGAGQQFDAPPAPLNMGLHWILRELVRLRVVDGEHLFPDCWVPSEQVLRFLRPLGLERLDGNASNSEKARAIFEFMSVELGTGSTHLHRAFDIPLRHVNADADLRRQLGWET